MYKGDVKRFMFLIGEFSKITRVSLRMLRYYDSHNVFKPKIKDEYTGYRYYTADQIDELYWIIQLRDSGFGVNEILQLLHLSDKEELQKRLTEKQNEIQEEMECSRMKLNKLKLLAKDLNDSKTGNMPEIKIVMKSIPTKEVLSLRRIMPDYYAEADLWKEMTEILMPYGFNEKSECFSLYHDEDSREQNVDIEICTVVDHDFKAVPEGLIHRQIEGNENAASIMIYGPYTNISKTYQKFAFWLEKHPEYMMEGPTRQICHVSECDTDNKEQFVTELLVPLKIR